MDRFAIFVDAGYPVAEAGKLSYDTADRLGLELNCEEAVSALAETIRRSLGENKS